MLTRASQGEQPGTVTLTSCGSKHRVGGRTMLSGNLHKDFILSALVKPSRFGCCRPGSLSTQAAQRLTQQSRPVRISGTSYTGLYYWPMKTAISLPDETFDRASRRARDLGMSRSEFFTRAAQRYLDELDSQSLTGQIDDALEHLGERLGDSDEGQAAAVAVGHRVLDAVDDEW